MSITRKINLELDKEREIREILSAVYQALKDKGYDPVSQLVGYLMSDDPTYITNHDGARGKIVRVERDELIEELLKQYLKGL